MRFYGTALLLQKGLPTLLLPYFVLVFGRDVYASYVLFYTTTQVVATIAGLGLPLALVPLWHRWPEPAALVKRCIRLVILATPVVFLVLLGCAHLFHLSGPPPISAAEAAGWICVFAAVYNFNTLAIAVARSLGRDRSFFLASLVGAAVLVAGLAIVSSEGWGGLRALATLQALALAAGSIVMLGRNAVPRPRQPASSQIKLKQILAGSLPLAVNALLVLLAMSVDKWTARRFFPGAPFSQYVIDYQAALTIAFVPVVTAMHLAPRLAAEAAKGSLEAICTDLAATRLITFAGAFAMAVTMAVYARATGLRLGQGYWIIVAAFLLESQYTISSNIATARQCYRSVMVVTSLALVMLVLVLGAAAMSGDWFVLYFAPLGYEIVLLAGISWVNRVNRSSSRAFSGEDSSFLQGQPPQP
jgi:O-antigen/teichoic acid export membrane protein